MLKPVHTHRHTNILVDCVRSFTFDSFSVMGNMTKLLRKKVKPKVATMLIDKLTNELSNTSSTCRTRKIT